jgi:hypothetical protein
MKKQPSSPNGTVSDARSETDGDRRKLIPPISLRLSRFSCRCALEKLAR